jgi:alpha-1,3-mannosyltransferase
MALPLSSIVASILRLSKRLLFDRNLFWVLASLVIVADASLTQLIIRFVPCRTSVTCRVLVFHQIHISDTEIDWETYMYHIKLYLDGERDYSAIDGPTGPMV